MVGLSLFSGCCVICYVDHFHVLTRRVAVLLNFAVNRYAAGGTMVI